MHLPPDPAGLLVAGLHGEEPETVLLARRLVERVPAAACSYAIVVCANPDGVADGVRQNARGVDLNRNFPSRSWRPGTSYTFPPGLAGPARVAANRTNASSTGTAPLSEPEAAALHALVERLQPALVVDLHAPLEVVLATEHAPAPVAQALGEAAGMRVLQELGSPTPGALRDWLFDRGVGSITYEVEHAGLPQLLQRHLPGLLQLVRSAPA